MLDFLLGGVIGFGLGLFVQFKSPSAFTDLYNKVKGWFTKAGTTDTTKGA